MNRRAGFTLIEVVLATALAALVLFGVYLAVDMSLSLMQAGRDNVDEATLARSLLQRMESDMTPALAPVTPTASSTSSGATTGDATTQPAASTAGAMPLFSAGVIGDSTTVSVYLTRLQRSTISPPQTADGNTNQFGGDIRRITYSLSGESGLARQESRLITIDDPANPAATSEIDVSRDILAEEVTQLEIRYYDGSGWLESWDGSATGQDGKTPLGPPRAIELTISIRRPNRPDTRTFRHVIAMPAAPGTAETSTSMP